MSKVYGLETCRRDPPTKNLSRVPTRTGKPQRAEKGGGAGRATGCPTDLVIDPRPEGE